MNTPNLDPQLERAIGRMLFAGVTTSSVCLAIGLCLSMMPAGAAAAPWLLNAGLIVLMITPVGRVAISVAEYARERDWTFVVLTVIVLLELVGGFVTAVR